MICCLFWVLRYIKKILKNLFLISTHQNNLKIKKNQFKIKKSFFFKKFLKHKIKQILNSQRFNSLFIVYITWIVYMSNYEYFNNLKFKKNNKIFMTFYFEHKCDNVF